MRSARAGRRRPLTGRTPFYYGWVILGVAALGVFASGPGQTYNFSVFLDPVIEETGWTRTQITGLYAAGSLTAAVLIIGVGRLLDRYGARVVLSAVVVLFGLAALWMSRVDSPLDLYLGFAFIRTLGQGAMTMVPTTPGRHLVRAEARTGDGAGDAGRRGQRYGLPTGESRADNRVRLAHGVGGAGVSRYGG